MIVGIVVALIGLGGVALGALQLGGTLPAARRAAGAPAAVSAYVNILIGLLLVALGVLRLTHTL